MALCENCGEREETDQKYCGPCNKAYIDGFEDAMNDAAETMAGLLHKSHEEAYEILNPAQQR